MRSVLNGTATAPVYEAHKRGINVHVWVDETRPRCQGSRLTAFELGHEGISHTIIADNASGALMARGEIDLVMRDADTVVFVEVRYRRKNQWGSAVETVDWRKQKRLIAAAQHYLITHPHLVDQPCRFDVVAAEGNPADPGAYRWIREAFTC